MPFCELYYHFVWGLEDHVCGIEPRFESRLYGDMRRKAIDIDALVFAVGGASDHVHMVASVPPKVALADFVGQVKGFSSHQMCQELKPGFRWQAGYGVLSFDRKRLPNYVAYVENQKCHHGEGTTIRVLERTRGTASEVYCEAYYHFVWTPRNRDPVIEPGIESRLHGHIRAKATELGARVFAVDGMPDHVHLVASLPPTMAPSRFIGQVKGFSSHEIGRDLGRRFGWQAEYGAFSFDRKRLPNYVAYVENQKRHHGEKTTIGVLERTTEPSTFEVREPVIPYNYEDEWRRELDSLADVVPS